MNGCLPNTIGGRKGVAAHPFIAKTKKESRTGIMWAPSGYGERLVSLSLPLSKIEARAGLDFRWGILFSSKNFSPSLRP